MSRKRARVRCWVGFWFWLVEKKEKNEVSFSLLSLFCPPPPPPPPPPPQGDTSSTIVQLSERRTRSDRNRSKIERGKPWKTIKPNPYLGQTQHVHRAEEARLDRLDRVVLVVYRARRAS